MTTSSLTGVAGAALNAGEQAGGVAEGGPVGLGGGGVEQVVDVGPIEAQTDQTARHRPGAGRGPTGAGEEGSGLDRRASTTAR